MKLRKSISIVLISILSLIVFSFTACNNVSSEKKVVFITQKLNNGEYFDNMSDIFKKQLEGAGFSYEYTGPEEWGASYQAEVFKKVVDSKPISIIIAPVPGEELYEAFKYANKKGVPIILVDTDINRELLASANASVTTFIGVDNYEGGKECADYMADKLPKGSKVAILAGGVNTANGENRCNGFKDEITSRGMNVVAELATNWSEEEGYEKGKLFLKAYPEITAVFTANSSLYKGLSKAAEEMNVTVYGATFDCDDITKNYMENGNLLCTFDQNIEGTAKAIVEVINKLLDGEKIDTVINSDGILKY